MHMTPSLTSPLFNLCPISYDMYYTCEHTGHMPCLIQASAFAGMSSDDSDSDSSSEPAPVAAPVEVPKVRDTPLPTTASV